METIFNHIHVHSLYDLCCFFPQESTPENAVTSLLDGCSVLRHVQHRHILQALGVYTNSQEPIMIMLAKTTFGTLKQFLDDIRLQGGPQSSYGKVSLICIPIEVPYSNLITYLVYYYQSMYNKNCIFTMIRVFV